jgi:AGZA family xanthine/uracil permease-like MFS transporter
MGARAGYTLATGVVIGLGAMTGALALLVTILPEAAVAPILVFIGLEITAQAFHASPPRHGAAVALAFVPVAAVVVLTQAGNTVAALGRRPTDLAGEAALGWQALTMLGNGFILTAVIWGWTLVAVIDRRFPTAAALLAVASAAALCGLVHSPLPNGALFWPWAATPATRALAGAYGIAAAMAWMATLSSGEHRR